MKSITFICSKARHGIASVAIVLFATQLVLAQGTFTDPKDPSLPIDFSMQGEYTGSIKGGGELGCQVIALGNGSFQAVVYSKGLPGAGWDEQNKILMDGKLDGKSTAFQAATGNKTYLAKPPLEFSATKTFPPDGHKAYSAKLANGTMIGKTNDGKSFELKKTTRKSETIRKKPPSGAIVLFDGTDADSFNGGRLDENTKLLNTDGKDIRTKEKFNNYTMHVEFMLPYRPDARGQGRGNSGFYQVDHYEVQILDSFGLEGLNNECGGIYTKAQPPFNMCFPPLTWQTYDVEFRNAVRDDNGKKTKNAFITLWHNGVKIYDNQEISGPTGGHRNEPEGTPGIIKLQGHGNPLQYRNIWIVKNE